MTNAQNGFASAKAQSDDADLALALERSHMERAKANWDKLRVETHGKLVALLSDKNEADAFFRPTAKEPADAAPE